jgi:hypothetical protein
MKTRQWQGRYLPVLNLLLLLTLLLIAIPKTGVAQQQGIEPDKPLENADVLTMRRAGIGNSVILAAVKHAPIERLDSSSEALAALRKSGIEETLITAIVGRVESRQKTAAAPKSSSGEGQAGDVRKPADIKLFFVDKPAEPFRELGRVSASKFGTLGRSRKREVIDEELKSKAVELGGDAVINITEDFASVSGVVVAFQNK